MQDVEHVAQIQPLAQPGRVRRPRMQAEPLRVVLFAKRLDRIGGHGGHRRNLGQQLAVRSAELQRAVGLSIDLIALLVHRTVMAATEQREVRERGWAALRPMMKVMALSERQPCSPESGSPGLGGGAHAAMPAESSGSGPRPPRCGRPRRAASPPGSRRTPGAATFPRERAPRPRGRTGRAASGSASAVASTWTTTWYRSPGAPGSSPWSRAASASRASASACCWAIVGRSADGSAAGSLKRVTSRSPRLRWYRVSRAAASAFMNRAPTSGSSRPRSTTVPSSSWWTCTARPACCRLVSRASALRSMQRQPRTMRSTWAAVPPRPTPSNRASVSGVATRVRARTLAYDSSPRARAWARSGRVPRARATRTFSRAVPRSSPIRQPSQSAQERNPVHQPPRASNSRMRSRRRAEAASRCADSSAI